VPPIPVRSLVLLVVLGAVAILSMAAIVVVLLTREDPQGSIVPPPAIDVPPLPAQPAPELVVRIESIPAGADVLEGGRFLGQTPLRLTVARSSLAGTRTFDVRKAGFLPSRLAQGPTDLAEVAIVAKLEPEPAPPPDKPVAPEKPAGSRPTGPGKGPARDKRPGPSDIRMER
jgi:serine/threonine-protein kinase